jgi:RimJ/RimL family protein N-acetyltransferase
MDIYPITLTGDFVRLEPLSEAYVPGLAAVGLDPQLWQYYPFGSVDTVEGMAALVNTLLAAQQKGTDLPFTVLHNATSQVIGMTRYMDIQPRNRALEIGGTWYAAAFQRTAVNTECKYLLLRHAFETLGCVRVQFKTDLRNERSQRAIERIGATREGVLRNHMLLPDGNLRSSVYFSILENEWPVVKARLKLMLSPS